MASTNGTVNGISQDPSTYSVPDEASKLFQQGILNNPLIAKDLPPEAQECSKTISFTGTAFPSIPINWRFAESVSSLKALEATLVNVLLKRKYNVNPQEVVVNTDHAELYIMSALLYSVDPENHALNTAKASTPEGKLVFNTLFPDYDIHNAQSSPHRQSATNIYKCKDGRYFHLHGSMNPEPTLKSLGLPPDDASIKTPEDSWVAFEDKIAQIDSEDLQKLASDVYKQAGTICWSTEEFANSEHGRANEHVGLYEIDAKPYPNQKPSWWPSSAETGPRRPLAGLKVVDLTRIIAAPAVTRGLAELGASVMRVTAPHLCDMSVLHPDLNWGKWNAQLDFRKEEDREKLRSLVRDADVVVQGYRPGVLDKYGFSNRDLLDLCKDRERGLVVVRENCYGWNGPWSYRSGWQQISDANTGVSLSYGQAMGHNEPVTPVFPNSDYCTGIAGVVGILDALLRRGHSGGSYSVSIALNYYSSWLTRFCGTYPTPIWNQLWAHHGNPVFQAHHNMMYTLPRMLGLLQRNSPHLFKQEYFEDRESKALGVKVRTVRPVLRYRGAEEEETVALGFNVGTRGNGKDKPVWPEDLMTEVVV